MLEQVWDDENNLVVFSSDLCHYLSYSQANHTDHQTCEQLCQLQIGSR